MGTEKELHPIDQVINWVKGLLRSKIPTDEAIDRYAKGARDFDTICGASSTVIYSAAVLGTVSIWDSSFEKEAKSDELQLRAITEVAWFLISALCRDLYILAKQQGCDVKIRDVVQERIVSTVVSEITTKHFRSRTNDTAQYNQLITFYNEAEIEFGTTSQINPTPENMGLGDNLAGISAVRLSRVISRETDVALQIELSKASMQFYIATDIPKYAGELVNAYYERRVTYCICEGIKINS